MGPLPYSKRVPGWGPLELLYISTDERSSAAFLVTRCSTPVIHPSYG